MAPRSTSPASGRTRSPSPCGRGGSPCHDRSYPAQRLRQLPACRRPEGRPGHLAAAAFLDIEDSGADPPRLSPPGARGDLRPVRDRADHAGSGAPLRQSADRPAGGADARLPPWRTGLPSGFAAARTAGPGRQADRRARLLGDHRRAGCAASCSPSTASIPPASPGSPRKTRMCRNTPTRRTWSASTPARRCSRAAGRADRCRHRAHRPAARADPHGDPRRGRRRCRVVPQDRRLSGEPRGLRAAPPCCDSTTGWQRN